MTHSMVMLHARRGTVFHDKGGGFSPAGSGSIAGLEAEIRSRDDEEDIEKPGDVSQRPHGRCDDEDRQNGDED